MIEKQFWINVKEAWIVSAQTKITNVHADSEEQKISLCQTILRIWKCHLMTLILTDL